MDLNGFHKWTIGLDISDFKKILKYKINQSWLYKLKNYQECVLKMKIMSSCRQTKILSYKYIK